MAEKILAGSWRNTLGSTVEFYAEPGLSPNGVPVGRLTGNYRTAVGNAVAGEISGSWVESKEGVIVSWSVSWVNRIDPSKPPSMTSWTGNLITGTQNRIETLWNLVGPPENGNPVNLWKTIHTNKDIFTKCEDTFALDKGYIVPPADKSFKLSLFHQHLKTDLLGRCTIHVAETDSTMKVAEKVAAFHSNPTGVVIIADNQTSGVGRVAGRTWDAKAGLNCLFTLLLSCKTFNDKYRIIFASALAVQQACIKMGAKTALIKWPNDVYINDRKVCGMLINQIAPPNNATGAENLASVGIGINVNEKKEGEGIGDPISLLDVVGTQLPRELLFAIVMNKLEEYLTMATVNLLQEYCDNSLLLKEGYRTVEVRPKGREQEDKYEAEVLEICSPSAEDATDGSYGLLKVKTSDGIVQSLSAEEVFIRPKKA